MAFIFIFNNLGLELGDDKSKCWVISLVVSIFAGILFIQPLQVKLLNEYLFVPFLTLFKQNSIDINYDTCPHGNFEKI